MKKKNDDHEIKIFNNAQTVGVIVMVSICIFLLIANAVVFYFGGIGKGIVSFDYIAIIFIYLAVVCFYSFAKYKNIYHLIIGLGFSFVFICTLIMYFINLDINAFFKI
ncbi:MAG: DUF6442 family protein [Treponema sp.]|nr:DUF6442 family protein [Treponema sp.]MCL2272729.1 DUF6442 family protein [Treponema sp.]